MTIDFADVKSGNKYDRNVLVVNAWRLVGCSAHHSRCREAAVSLSPRTMRILSPPCDVTAWLLCVLWHAAQQVLAEGSEIPLHYRILEESPVGSYVGSLLADTGLDKRYDKRTLSKLTFRFLSQPTVTFQIDTKRRVLNTGEKVDRDQLCPNKDRCEVRLDIAVWPVEYFQIIKVAVEIIDINDNFPTFPETTVTHDILESALPGTTFPIPAALDPDSRIYGIHRYEIIPGTDLFDLRTTNKVDGSTDVRLVLRQQLDRERKSRVRVKVVAFDGGEPPKSGSIDVIINVIDANDNSPHFVNSTYRVDVLENVARGSTLLRVTAHDPDHGRNGRIVYGFSERTRKNYGHMFGIHNTTGEIFVRGALDYEHSHVFQLVTVARDQGAGTSMAEATVIVTLIDENDNRPDVQVNTLSTPGTDISEVPENAVVGSFVAHITVQDPDSGAFGQVNCTLNHAHFKLLHLDDTEYQIVTAQPLDREKATHYNLELMCKDRGPDPQVTVKYLQIRVKDVNDHSPVFAQKSYKANLLENNYVGALIVTVNATDADSGPFGKFHYTIRSEHGDAVSGAAQLLRIHPSSGAVRARAVFDREKTPEIRAQVLAVDDAESSRVGTASLVITIQDRNDEVPVFEQTHYSFGVFENQPADTVVGVVRAHDEDAPPHNVIEYSIIPSRTASDAFRINAESGEIRTRRELDREEDAMYTLVVLAKDSGSPPLSSSVTVQVPLADQNDNSPVVEYPSTSNNTIQISNKVPLGYVVTRVRAHDRDVNKNGRLDFDFSRGNEQKIFAIDQSLGIVSVSKDVSAIDYAVFELKVTVKDRGKPPKSAVANLNVVVNKTVRYTDVTGSRFLSGYNLTIVVGVACVSGVVAMFLIVCVVCLRRKEHTKQQQQKYNCRMEALKMLSSDHQSSRDMSSEETHVSQGRVPNGNIYTNTYSKSQDRGTAPRKEVRFRQDDVSMAEARGEHQALYYDTEHPSEAGAEKDGAGESLLGRQSQSHKVYPKSGASSNLGVAKQEKPSWTLSQNELEVHQLLNILKDHDADSAYSGEGSNTDSGRGHSLEDGERPSTIPEETSSGAANGGVHSLRQSPRDPEGGVAGRGGQDSAATDSVPPLQTFGSLHRTCKGTSGATGGKLTFSHAGASAPTTTHAQTTCVHGHTRGPAAKHDCISRWQCTPYSKGNMPLGYHTISGSGSHGNLYGSRGSVQSQHSIQSDVAPHYQPPPPIYEKYNSSPYASRRSLLQGDATVSRDSFGIPTAPLSRSTVASAQPSVSLPPPPLAVAAPPTATDFSPPPPPPPPQDTHARSNGHVTASDMCNNVDTLFFKDMVA